MKTSVLSLVAALVLGTLQASGGNGFHAITTARGNGADSYVDGGSPSSNYGAGASFTAKGSANRKSYFRFDISGVPKPLKFASLEMTLTGARDRTPSFYGLNDGSAAGGGHLGEDWGEAAITWNNAPGHTNIYAVVEGTGTANGGECRFLQSVEYFSDMSATGGVGRVVLSGETLLDFLNDDTDGLVTFIVTNPGTVDITWKSKENADGQPPRLLLGDATSSPRQLAAVADAYVVAGSPSANYGTGEHVVVRANSGILKGYARFDLTGVRRPILAASLSVEQSGTAQWERLATYGLNNGATAGAGKLGEVWSDAEITAENAPANAIGDLGFVTGSATADGGEAQLVWITRSNLYGVPGQPFLVTADQPLLDFLNADTNDTVTVMMNAFGTTGTRAIQFAARENADYGAASLVLLETPAPLETLIVIR